jgi:uncharacterized protein (DUF58 family)
MKLLDAQDYRLLNRLSLAAKHRIAGLATGEQRSPVQGGGIEFADYRDYQPGDDIRRIDWAVFLRLRRLLVKLGAEEKELTLMILLDISLSMRFGAPDKLWLAARLAAALAGIALHDGCRAGIAACGPSLKEMVRPNRQRTGLAAIVKALEELEPLPGANLSKSIRQFSARYGRKCLMVFISDLLAPEWPATVAALSASGCEGYVLQLLAPEELNPPQLGEVTFVDLEDQSEIPLHLDRRLLERYRAELAGFLNEVRQTCHRMGLGHSLIPTDAKLSRILQNHLQKEGLLC